MKRAFHAGDRIQALPLDHLKPILRGAFGVIVQWAHDDLYYVQIDGLSHESVLEASEMIALAEKESNESCRR
jgi:hypothetical protein